MKFYRNAFRVSAYNLILAILVSSCTSATYIQSVPSGARIYIDGEPAGTTPHIYADTKIVSSTTKVRLEKEGYEPLSTSFSRDEELDVGALVGGLFVYVPLLWVMKYKPNRTYELKSLTEPEPTPALTQPTQQDTKVLRLREYKKLLDEKILTQEEYEREKKRILDEK